MEEPRLGAKREDDLRRRGEMVRISERNAQKDNHPGQVPSSQSMEAACDSQQ